VPEGRHGQLEVRTREDLLLCELADVPAQRAVERQDEDPDRRGEAEVGASLAPEAGEEPQTEERRRRLAAARGSAYQPEARRRIQYDLKLLSRRVDVTENLHG
jgi:hypothetical protein